MRRGSLTDCDRGHFTYIPLISDILLHIKSDILIFYENTTTSSHAYCECDLQTLEKMELHTNNECFV